MGKVIDEEAISNGINRICSGTIFTGNIVAVGDIRIDGNLNGNLTTKGKLVVGETGRIKGDISCKSCDVLGAIEGRLVVSDLLALKSTARVTGGAKVLRLMVEVGAIFEGDCNMINRDAPKDKDGK
jgi:cytoskeletal protein CcmA (bactofilin family)